MPFITEQLPAGASKPASGRLSRRGRNSSLRTRIQWYLAVGFIVMNVVFLFFWRPLAYIYFFMLPLMLASTYWYSRGFCGWACPRAAFLERIWAKVSLNRPVPAFMKQWWFAALVTILIFGNLIRQIVTRGWLAGGFAACLIPTVIAAAVGLYSPRAWCAFCPSGTLLKLADLGRFRVGKRSNCTQCGLCDKVCPFAIKVSEIPADDRIATPICVQCGCCVEACPRTSLALPTKTSA